MNKPTHTPGPWTFVQGGTGNYPTWNVRIGGTMLHLPGAFDMGVMDANARLIAAAPELLECLRFFLPLVRSVDDCGPSGEGWQSEELMRLIETAERAVAKVTGTP